jgi:hypothetical protein
MPNNDGARWSMGNKLHYEIVQSSSDPNRPWHLIGRDAARNECCRVGFATYGDAWRAAERRKADTVQSPPDFLNWGVRGHESSPSEYTSDILTWSDQQAALLRRVAAGENVFDQIDWENVAEEVQSTGRRQLEALKSLLVQTLASLLKVRAWPKSAEVRRWRTEASECQRDAAAIITPKMRQKIDINSLYFKAIRCLPKTINGEESLLFPTECPVTFQELLED